MPTPTLRAVALGEQLADLLRARIVRGEMEQGTHLVEDSMAAEYGVSRGPVRDALKALLAEGLLESRRRGYFVKAFTQDDVDELYEIRTAAEQLACELALIRAEVDDWGEAERLLEEMREAAESGDQHGFAHADLLFHTQFYVNSGNSRLLGLWHQYQPTFTTLLAITNAQDADLRPSFEDHRILLDLARARDTARFAPALEEHLAGSHRRLSAAVRG